MLLFFFFFFSSRRRHTRFDCDWSSDVCSSDLATTYQSERVTVTDLSGKKRSYKVTHVPHTAFPGVSVSCPKSVSVRSEEHTSELQSQSNLVCRLLLEKKKKNNKE